MTARALPDNAEVLLTTADMQAGFDRLAAALQPVVDSAACILLPIMTGGLYPAAQLMSRLQGDYLVDYCHATRYDNSLEGGELAWERRIPAAVAGRTVLLIDDIFDAGITLAAVAGACQDAGAVAVHTVIEVVKDCERDPGIAEPEFTTGLRVPDIYVFGCGMDLHGHWRHLPAVYGLRG